MSKQRKISSTHILGLICVAIIFSGMLLRAIVFLQNRNLFLDEVNLFRNLYERSFAELLLPLSYEQFAPIPFLLISKLAYILFGPHEMVLRLYPFICGLLCVIGFYKLLKQLNVVRGGIYPLFLMASGLIYVRYATEFKQYASDELISILLVLLALRHNPKKTKAVRLFIIWSAVGFFAIWFSMPSVFILAGIGTSFVLQAKRTSLPKLPVTVSSVILLWIFTFLLNYFLFLKPGIQSDYLQNWHINYFLFLMPSNAEEWGRNMDTLYSLFGTIGGHWTLSLITNLLLLLIGVIYLMRKNQALSIILILPVILLLLAAGLHRYTLLSRVCLFVFPMVLLIMGVGLEQCFKVKHAKFIAPLIILSCVITVVNFNSFKYMFTPLKFDWTTDNFRWINERQIPSTHCYVHEFASMPVLSFYPSG